jgi:hypothetical protein
MHWIGLRVAWLATAALTLATACIVDRDEPCSRGQVELKGPTTGCICERGSVPSPDNTSCMPCNGEHEEAMNGACQCESGYKRVAGSCMAMIDAGAEAASDAGPKAPSGLDTSCTGQSDCASFDADFCVPFPGAMACTVRNCANKENACPADRVCCDVSGANGIFPDLMMAKGICSSSEACAMGGKVVTP